METQLMITDKSPDRASEGKIILISALIISIAFNICFRGEAVTASLSSMVFFNGMSAGLYFILKALGILKNKKAFILALPIFLLSVFNAYFEYSYYNIFNCIGFYILFAVMTLKAAALSPKVSIDSFLSLMLNNCISGTAVAAEPAKEINLSRLKRAALGFMFSIPVLCVIITLLISGDDAFSQAWDSLFIFDFNFGSVLWTLILFIAVGVYFCGYLYCLISKHRTISIKGCKTDNTVAISFLTPVNLLFVFFCISQFRYVGSGMEIPEFTTYSGYVREGFFQLLLVTFINFTIILAFTEVLKDIRHKALKASLIALCAFTFVLILSSYYRMYLYINAYGFTPLRIEVLTFLTAEVALVFITIHAIVKERLEIISHFVFFGILSLMVLNIAARPEVSSYLNCTLQQYEAAEHYGHADIPVLIDRYGKSANNEERYAIIDRIITLCQRDNSAKTPWQSISIQEIINDRLAGEFIGGTIEK